MTGFATTALTGFFLLSSTGTLAGAGVLQAPKAEEPKPIELRTLSTHTVTMTGYNAVPEQTDSDPFTTASGAYSNPEIIAARSVDLADELPFGTVIEVTHAKSSSWCGFDVTEKFIGLRVIGDSMHPRMKNKIDILFGTDDWVRQGGKVRNPANALGICHDVKIRVVGRVEIKNIPKTQQELFAAIIEPVITADSGIAKNQ